MPDLLWSEVENFFDPDLMGRLPDLWVPDASVEDWQAVFDLVRSSGWEWEYEVDGTARPLPAAAEVLPRPVDAVSVLLRVRPVPGVQVNFWPMSATEIDFDVDLRELQGQAGVEILRSAGLGSVSNTYPGASGMLPPDCAGPLPVYPPR